MQKPDLKCHIINTPELFNQLQNYVKKLNPEIVVLDVETNSVVEKTATLYGIGLCFNGKEAFYIPWRQALANILFDKEDSLDTWVGDDKKNIDQWLEVICKNLNI